MATEKTEIQATRNPNLAEEGKIYHNAAILALKLGYPLFTPHADEYPYLGHLYRDQVGPFGLTVINQYGKEIIRPLSDTLNLGLSRKEREKLEEAKKTGLFDAYMVASSCLGPFDKRKPYRSQRLTLVAYVGIKNQPIRFGQYTYETIPPHFIALNGMGFVIST